jgi:hypothetical protein
MPAIVLPFWVNSCLRARLTHSWLRVQSYSKRRISPEAPSSRLCRLDTEGSSDIKCHPCIPRRLLAPATKGWHRVTSSRGCNISCKCYLYMCSLLVVPDVCLLSLLTGGITFSNHTCHLGTGYHTAYTSPPSSFTEALICSWAWSMVIAEKLHAVFLTAKLPVRNWLWTSG